MSGQSTLTSIRLDDDTLQGLDMLVGQDGLNTRSDVIRLAIQQLLHGQARLPGMKSVRIPVGRQMERHLASLYELYGVTHEQAASEGLILYIQKKLAEAKGIQNELDDVVTDSIGATQASKEYHE
ncbi:MAG: ribbon-helix-helix domain-containing protein [Candidatus Poseidoniaceae archaeon]